MRPALLFAILSIAVGAAHAGSLSSRLPFSGPLRQASQPAIDLDAATAFEAQRRAHDDADLLLHRPGSTPQFVDTGILPSVTVGPFRASLGGTATVRVHSGSYNGSPGNSWSAQVQRSNGASAGLNLDAEGIWGSHFSGSVTSRSARITFTLPMP